MVSIYKQSMIRITALVKPGRSMLVRLYALEANATNQTIQGSSWSSLSVSWQSNATTGCASAFVDVASLAQLLEMRGADPKVVLGLSVQDGVESIVQKIGVIDIRELQVD